MNKEKELYKQEMANFFRSMELSIEQCQENASSLSKRIKLMRQEEKNELDAIGLYQERLSLARARYEKWIEQNKSNEGQEEE
jgi:hypothetical protein